MPEVVIGLTQEDFRKIVAGRAIDVEVKLRGVQWWIRIGLKEIDIPKMVEALRDAMDGMGNGKVETGTERHGTEGEGPDPSPQDPEPNAPGADHGPENGSGHRGVRIEHQGVSNRVHQGKTREFATGQLILPLPKGWIVDTSHSTGCFTIERHGQKYAEILVIKLEE